MPNARQYYPIIAVGFAPNGLALNNNGFVSAVGSGGYRAAKGVQSIGSNTSFALQQIFQLGQLSLYENIEDLPNINFTVEKVLDGYPLLQHLATPTATSATLAGRYNDQQCMCAVAYYDITRDSATGIPLSTTIMSGVYVDSISINGDTQGSITESVSFVCRNRTWNFTPSGVPWVSGTHFASTGGPVMASGGVQRREDVDMTFSRWPRQIPGVSGNGVNPSGSNGFGAHIQSFSVSVNLGRTDLLELGRKGEYFRFATFPAEVTSSFSVTANERADGMNVVGDADNLTDETILIQLRNGVKIDLGSRNKLASIDQSGGDTGGGNVTLTYNYSNFNDYTCTFQTQDPAGLSG